MRREWNTQIFLSFVFAAAMALGNILGLTHYEPFNAVLRNGTLLAIAVGIIAGPLLTYFGITRSRSSLTMGGILLPVLCATPGVLLHLNGRNDTSPLRFYEGTVIGREVGKVKSSTVFKVQVQLTNAANHRLTIWTSKEKFEVLEVGSSQVGVPGKAGNLGIPWRVKGEPIRLIRQS